MVVSEEDVTRMAKSEKDKRNASVNSMTYAGTLGRFREKAGVSRVETPQGRAREACCKASWHQCQLPVQPSSGFRQWR